MWRISKRTNCRPIWRKFPSKNLEVNDERTETTRRCNSAGRNTGFHFRVLPLLGWPQNDRRRHRRDPDSFRDRPFAGKFADLSRPGLDQRLLAASPRSWSVALVDPHLPSRQRDFAYLFHNPARDRKQARATRIVPRPELRESELGVAAHVDKRAGRARVHHLSPAPFHIPHD